MPAPRTMILRAMKGLPVEEIREAPPWGRGCDTREFISTLKKIGHASVVKRIILRFQFLAEFMLIRLAIKGVYFRFAASFCLRHCRTCRGKLEAIALTHYLLGRREATAGRKSGW